MTIPRLVIAATKSGSGKTTITCALLQALLQRGEKVRSFKCGPDYIDPMFHEKVIGIPSGNLDLYFTDEELTKSFFLKDLDDDMAIVEGVMGLYDGVGGITQEASTYHLAQTLDAPILLVLNARGMGRSILAEIKGFLDMDQNHLIRGILLNQIPASFFETVKPFLEKETGIPVFGFFPTCKDLTLESRHLGLMLPDEVDGLKEKTKQAAGILEDSVDLDGLLSMMKDFASEHPISGQAFETIMKDRISEHMADHADANEQIPAPTPKVRIAVAKDRAFNFYYRTNLDLLELAGAELLFFSPLKDKTLPEGTDGILIGGGYPELMCEELSANGSMRESILKAIKSGTPSLCECGGFMYLHEILVGMDGKEYPMVGAIPGKCFHAGKLVRFGYAEFENEQTKSKIRGHEFHHYDSESNGEDRLATKPFSGRSFRCMHEGEDHLWGFGHLYYASDPEFVKWFMECCRKKKSRKGML